jgi:Ohr subfamily peroxiredoxin
VATAHAACFHSAVKSVARKATTKLTDSTVTAEVGLINQDSGWFGRGAAREIELPGLEQGQADDLVAQAHQVRPYSNATRGNVEVELAATV